MTEKTKSDESLSDKRLPPVFEERKVIILDTLEEVFGFVAEQVYSIRRVEDDKYEVICDNPLIDEQDVQQNKYTTEEI